MDAEEKLRDHHLYQEILTLCSRTGILWFGYGISVLFFWMWRPSKGLVWEQAELVENSTGCPGFGMAPPLCRAAGVFAYMHTCVAFLCCAGSCWMLVFMFKKYTLKCQINVLSVWNSLLPAFGLSSILCSSSCVSLLCVPWSSGGVTMTGTVSKMRLGSHYFWKYGPVVLGLL